MPEFCYLLDLLIDVIIYERILRRCLDVKIIRPITRIKIMGSGSAN